MGKVPTNNDPYLVVPKCRYKILSYLHLFYLIVIADKIFLHDLTVINFMTKKLWLLLPFLPRSIIRKFYWIIWGGDLYSSTQKQSSCTENKYDRLTRIFVRKIVHIVTPIKGDYEFSKEVFGHNAEYHFAYYPSFINRGNTSLSMTKSEKYLLLGNSADPSNNHMEIFGLLKKKHFKGKIICPLSYGDKTYAEEIVEYGVRYFGDRFIPLLKCIPYDEYSKLMDSIGVAVFAHDRQQALGNIIPLIARGKKVYIKKNITSWSFLNNIGISIHDIQEISITKNTEDIFNEDYEILMENSKQINCVFNDEQLRKNWELLLK